METADMGVAEVDTEEANIIREEVVWILATL